MEMNTVSVKFNGASITWKLFGESGSHITLTGGDSGAA